MPKANITRLTGLDIQPDPTITRSTHGFYVPKLSTVTINLITPVATGGELRNGLFVYNSTTNTYQGYQTNLAGSARVNFNTSVATAATGVGLAVGSSPFIPPLGTNGTVQVAANQVIGFTYYDTTSNTLRYWNGTTWKAISAP